MTENNTEINNHPKADIARVLYSILFLIIDRMMSTLLFLIVIVQLIHSWVKGKPNETLLDFTSALSEYAKQIIAYVGFNSDEKPWPMGKWSSK